MEPLDIHKYRSDPAVFIIWLRNEDGKPERTYEDNEPTKLLVVYCINVVRYMLLDVEVEVAFKNTAREYSKVHPNSWYMEDPEPEYHMYKIARIFYESILDKFPNVFVDYTMKNPDNLGSHSRREWVEFNPRNQSIQINGMRTRHMVEAKERSRGKHPDHADTRDFHRFIFMFTNVILHEISHVFITFLSKGAPDTDTPIHMNAPVHGQVVEPVGEAGRWLEKNLFQGTIHYFCDPKNRTLAHQCSLPYVKKDTGTHRIKEGKIYDTIKTSFEFPYKHRQLPEENLKSMSDLPWDRNTDPLEEPEMKGVRGSTFTS